MISLKKNDQGFTIVELLIVIVVIGILALLVITTYGGIQAKARNAKRQTDVKTLQTQIEAFFSQNGYYPNLTDMNSATWRAANMKSLDSGAIQDPSGSCTASATPGTCFGGSGSGVAKQYQYQAFQSDGATTCDGASGPTTDQTCAQYTLTAEFEGTVNGATSTSVKNLD